jgi:hypothetical protein
MRKREYERKENGQNVVIKIQISWKNYIMQKNNVIEMEKWESDVETKIPEDDL